MLAGWRSTYVHMLYIYHKNEIFCSCEIKISVFCTRIDNEGDLGTSEGNDYALCLKKKNNIKNKNFTAPITLGVASLYNYP